MATFALIHGAGSEGWYWHAVVPALEAAGHAVVAPDLPCDDDRAGLDEYTDTVVAAIAAVAGSGGSRDDLVVVGQSLGGFTAPLVCERVGARLLVLVAAMTPAPGETPGDWWANTGWEQARLAQAEQLGRPGIDFDLDFDFFDDVAPSVRADVFARGEKGQSGTPFEKPWPLASWPEVPTRFLLCRHDHFFPAEFQRRVVSERLGITPDEMDGGHLAAFSRPDDLAARLLAYWSGQTVTPAPEE
jgi:pimeloyl-ACP methyl ester carboxylesterase